MGAGCGAARPMAAARGPATVSWQPKPMGVSVLGGTPVWLGLKRETKTKTYYFGVSPKRRHTQMNRGTRGREANKLAAVLLVPIKLTPNDGTLKKYASKPTGNGTETFGLRSLLQAIG